MIFFIPTYSHCVICYPFYSHSKEIILFISPFILSSSSSSSSSSGASSLTEAAGFYISLIHLHCFVSFLDVKNKKWQWNIKIMLMMMVGFGATLLAMHSMMSEAIFKKTKMRISAAKNWKRWRHLKNTRSQMCTWIHLNNYRLAAGAYMRVGFTSATTNQSFRWTSEWCLVVSAWKIS